MQARTIDGASPHASNTPAAPQIETFDPAAWLARFETVGGAYMLSDRLSLAILIEGRPDDDVIAARHLVNGLSEADRAQIVAHLRQRRDGGEG